MNPDNGEFGPEHPSVPRLFREPRQYVSDIDRVMARFDSLEESMDEIKSMLRRLTTQFYVYDANRNLSRLDDTHEIKWPKIPDYEPPFTPRTLGEFKELKGPEVESLMSYYGIKPKYDQFENKKMLASHIGIHPEILNE